MIYIFLVLILTISARAKPTAFVHLFEWKWSDIAIECKEFLGPKGYSAVQISPPNEHVILKGTPWYQRYQPVSYILKSQSGNEAEFINMVRTCKDAGVEIYVDAIINHMTGTSELDPIYKGSAGSSYGHYEYPGLYGFQDFHHCGRNSGNEIQNWFDRWEVQNCELVNLADLKTESSYVQTMLKAYLRKLVNIGVRGFRIDAAKHIPSQDLEKIIDEIRPYAFIYQEIIGNPDEPIQAHEYLQFGSVTEFKYVNDLSNILQRGKLSWINNNLPMGEGWGYLKSSKAIVFIDNHDTQRVQGYLTHKERKKYLIANILMLAWPYGYPQVMSSYKFEDWKEGPPSHANGSTMNVHGAGGIGCLKDSGVQNQKGWICEHRWDAIANMVEFRKITEKETTIRNWWSNNNNQIAFGRGNKGFVVLNNEKSELNQKLQTGLPAGTYQDIIMGQIVEVDRAGWASVKVGAESALVIHVGRLAGMTRISYE